MKPTPLGHGPGVALAALGSLAFGAVLGPEAPVTALGSLVGLTVTRFVALDALATAGAWLVMAAFERRTRARGAQPGSAPPIRPAEAASAR